MVTIFYHPKGVYGMSWLVIQSWGPGAQNVTIVYVGSQQTSGVLRGLINALRQYT